MASSASTVIAIGWLFLAGGAVGFFLGRRTTESSQGSDPATSAPATQDLAPVLAELRKLNESLLLQHGNGSPAPTPASDREPAAPRAETAERFEAIVDHLDQILKSAEARLGRSQVTIEGAKGKGYPSLDAMFQAAESSRDPFGEEVKSRHILWSLEDAIERYGTPSSTNAVDGNLYLEYSRTGSSGQTAKVTLAVASGLVFMGWYQ